MIDQRTQRKLFIGLVDGVLSKITKRQLQRRLQRNAQSSSVDQAGPSTSFERHGDNQNSPNLVESPLVISEEIDPDYQESSQKKSKLELPSVAELCDRALVSDRAAASIATAALKDAGLISGSDDTLVIDKSKIRRARKKSRSKKIATQSTEDPLRTLFYDGRKDQTEQMVIP